MNTPQTAFPLDSTPFNAAGKVEGADKEMCRLKPISTAPRDGRYILLAGPSGYNGTLFRFEAGRWDETRKGKFRRNPWMNHAGDDFTDGGEPPTHWTELPTM